MGGGEGAWWGGDDLSAQVARVEAELVTGR